MSCHTMELKLNIPRLKQCLLEYFQRFSLELKESEIFKMLAYIWEEFGDIQAAK